MVNLSSAMGAQFAEVVARVTEKIRGLGLNPLRADADIGDADIGDADIGDADIAEPNGG